MFWAVKGFWMTGLFLVCGMCVLDGVDSDGNTVTRRK